MSIAALSITTFRNSMSRAKQNNQIGQLFYNSWTSINPYEVLAQAREQIRTGPDYKKAKDFENFLNGIYGRHKRSDIYGPLLEATQKYINSQISNTEIKDENGEFKASVKGQKEPHKQTIRLTTLWNNLQEATNMINSSSLGLLEKIYPNVTNIVLSIWKDFLQIIFDDDLYKIWITKTGLSLRKLNKDENNLHLVERIDTLTEAMRIANKNYGAIYGEGFERSLDALNQLLNEGSESQANDILDKVFSNEYKTAGAELVNRGSIRNGINLNYTIINSGLKDRIIRKPNWNTLQTLRSDEYVTITSFDKTKGKMDVEFKMPEEEGSGTFRISAKSWSDTSKRDFGDTTLFNAMARTVGINDTLSWGLVQGYYGPKGKIYPFIEAYKYAKACLFVDIVIGYSQKENYADTIVVQDRGGNPERPVSVYSIRQLIEKIIPNIEKIPIPQFDNVLKTIDLTTQSSKWWLSRLQAQMHAKRLAISSSLLDFYGP